jgi:hypothetical protein
LSNEVGDCVAKKGTNISETYVCKMSFHSAKLRIKENIKADTLQNMSVNVSTVPGTK